MWDFVRKKAGGSGFWIADFGLGIWRSLVLNPKSKIENRRKRAFFRHIADELNRRLSVRREDVFISLVFVDREDWSFGNGEPW
jgi:hypothetical protein